MSRLDLVVFGATGFTGRQTAIEAARLAREYNLTWAIAGRAKGKLVSVLEEVTKKTGEDCSSIKMIIADVGDEQSLKDMCSQAKVIVNCCGPYRLYGEPVVKAAIEKGAHHVDVCGEPQFIETMQLRYDAAARSAGVYVINACGLDSIPNDMGVMFLKQNFKGTLNSVESYMSTYIPPELRSRAINGVINYGTWDSLVRSVAHMSELSSLRKQLYPQRLPALQPKLQARSAVHYRNNKPCVPFPGADLSIVYRTQRYLYEHEQQRPVQFKPYIRMPNFLLTLTAIFASLIIYAMTRTTFTINLLLKYPRLFSFGVVTRDGPDEQVMNATSFKVMFYGEGWAEGADVDNSKPDKKIVGKVSGVNPGYGATVTALLLSAITILKEHEAMPSTGGILTTGAAFQRTNLIKNLHEHNLKFEIVEDN